MQGCRPPAQGLTQPERVEMSAQRLLIAAAELIVEKGWEATTAAEIGRRAGYSRAMVHARYGSKDAILTAFQQTYVARLNPDPEPDADGLAQVLAHFERIQEIHAVDPALMRAMFVSAFEAVKTVSPLREPSAPSCAKRPARSRPACAPASTTDRSGPISISTAHGRTSPRRSSGSPTSGSWCPRITISTPRSTAFGHG